MIIIFYHFFLLGRCVRAEAAAVLAALLDLGLRNTFEAAVAAFLLVTSVFFFLVILRFPYFKISNRNLADHPNCFLMYRPYQCADIFPFVGH